MTNSYIALRWAVGIGIAALTAGAANVFAPHAAAADLAPGVSCNDQGFCRNDTDDIYYVTGLVTCSEFPHQQAISGYVGRHGTDQIAVGCPDDYTPGQMEQGPPTLQPDGTFSSPPMTQSPGSWTDNRVLSVEWQSATVDNDQKLGPTNSGSGS